MNKLVIILPFALLVFGCAGPSTPFGAIEFASADGRLTHVPKYAMAGTNVTFSPSRQVLHKPADVNVEFKNTLTGTENFDIRVIYNGREVTQSFKKRVEESFERNNNLKISIHKLRLSPRRKHDIEFYYRNSNNTEYFMATYLPPVCKWEGFKSIKNTEPFSPDSRLLKTIKQQAKVNRINENLLAGLIAQESGFDIKKVSTARAVGLTQITPIAAEEVEKIKSDWKRYKKFNNYSPATIQYFIDHKKVSAREDWRLSEAKSVEGGALYLNYLDQYWKDDANLQLLHRYPKIQYGDVILASYNSGASRVKSQIVENHEHWLEQSNLKEAFRYVNNVSSYCYHFSESVK